LALAVGFGGWLWRLALRLLCVCSALALRFFHKIKEMRKKTK